MSATTPTSKLFYQVRVQRPRLDHAEGVYLWDVDGKRYLDGSSGAMVSNIGHSNPRVLAAMKAQMDRSTFAYRLHFANAPAEQLADRLSARLHAGMERVFFVSGGSEAVESCLKLARQYAVVTGQPSRWKVISRFPSYHGSTFGSLGITGMTPMTAPFAPMLRDMPKIPATTCYLDRDDLTDHQRGLRYAEMLRDKIESEGPESVLAFIMEPIGGASTGALVAPDSYYMRIREICDEYGILLIADEVITGAGRTGRFMAMEHWGVEADILAISKGFGGGYVPLGAMVAHRSIADAVNGAGGFTHGFTYAGNPLACIAGLTVLDVIESENLLENVTTMGAYLKSGLQQLMTRYPFIGDVRGKGLLLAIELVSDRDTMAPLPKEMSAFNRLVDLAYERGLIIYSRRTRGGLVGDHFMVCPPFIVTREQVDEIIDKLGASLDAFAAEMRLPVTP